MNDRITEYPPFQAIREDGTVPHIPGPNGSRFHVKSYHLTKDGVKIKCNEPRCELNKHETQTRKTAKD